MNIISVWVYSRRPLSRELRDARERAAGAHAALGASVRTVHLPSWRDALLPFIATLQAESTNEHPTLALLDEAGEQRPTWSSLLRRGGTHTLPARVALAAELLPSRRRRNAGQGWAGC